MTVGKSREPVTAKSSKQEEMQLTTALLDCLKWLRAALSEVHEIVDDDETNQSFPYRPTIEEFRVKSRKNARNGKIFNKKGAEHLVGRHGVASANVGAEEKKCRPGGSAKVDSCTNLLMPPSLSKIFVCFIVGRLLLKPSAGADGALTSMPVNTLCAVGQTLRMNCSTDLSRSVYWARTVVGSDEQQWLYYGKDGFDGSNADDRFSTSNAEEMGKYDLIMADVQEKDAGQYICIDESGIGARASAELVVSDPMKCHLQLPPTGVMGYNVFGIPIDFVYATCSLTYTGNLSPTLEWSLPGSGVQSIELNFSTTTSSVTSTLMLSPTREQSNASLQCKTKIKDAAQNTIDSGLCWESETINVKYAEFASEEVESCPGIKWNLFCNPQCTYQFECADNACQCMYTYYDTRSSQKYYVTLGAVNNGTINDIRLDIRLVIMLAAAGLASSTVAVTIVLVCVLNKKSPKRPSSDASSESGQNCCDDNSRKAMLHEVKNITTYL